MKSISFEDIINLNITPACCVSWADEVIRMKKDCELPPKISIKFGEDHNSFFNTMPSLIPSLNRFGMKEVSRLPLREPALKADILLYDTLTGNLLSLMDGTWITTMRTGAVAAITINKLQKKDTKLISFMGLGNTARATLLCYNSIIEGKDIDVAILEYKDQHKSFIQRFKDFSNIHFITYNNVRDMIRDSDVVVSCVTAANSCFAEPEDFKPGTLVVPVHTKGFQNCDLVFDKIFCDDIGHIEGFKYFKSYKSVTEMTDLLNGNKTGRDTEEQRILAYNIGISLQDVLFASKIYDLIDTRDEILTEKFWV